MVNKFSILNEAKKYFSSGIFQNYLVFTRAKEYIRYVSGVLGLICGDLMECPKKILKI